MNLKNICLAGYWDLEVMQTFSNEIHRLEKFVQNTVCCFFYGYQAHCCNVYALHKLLKWGQFCNNIGHHLRNPA